MSVAVSSKRYAQAIFQIAGENNEFEKWQKSLDEIAKLMLNTELVSVFESPKITFEQKAQLLKNALGQIDTLALNYAYLLVLKNKFKNAAQIAQQYTSLLDESRGIKRSVIITSMPLEDTEKNKLNQQLEKITGHKLESDFEVKPDILGGFIARIDGTLIDGSIRSRLLELKNSIGSKEM